MSKIADAEANATSLDGLVNDNGLITTLRNGPKPSWQYIVDQVYAQLGYAVVGSFVDGFTYTGIRQVGADASGNTWIYTGGEQNLPHVVPAGTVPSAPDYFQVSVNSADNVVLDNGENLQQAIDRLNIEIDNLEADGVANSSGGTVQDFIDRKDSFDGGIYLILDDANATTLNDILPVVSGRGFKFGIAPYLFGIASSYSFVRLSQMLNYKQINDGEILSHSSFHVAHNASLDLSTGNAYISAAARQFNQYGFNVNGFVAPNSVLDSKFMPRLKQEHDYAFVRSVGVTGVSAAVNALDDDMYNLVRVSLESITQAQAQAYVDYAVETNTYLVFYTHTNVTYLSDLIDYIQASGAKNINPSEWVGRVKGLTKGYNPTASKNLLQNTELRKIVNADANPYQWTTDFTDIPTATLSVTDGTPVRFDLIGNATAANESLILRQNISTGPINRYTPFCFSGRFTSANSNAQLKVAVYLKDASNVTITSGQKTLDLSTGEQFIEVAEGFIPNATASYIQVELTLTSKAAGQIRCLGTAMKAEWSGKATQYNESSASVDSYFNILRRSSALTVAPSTDTDIVFNSSLQGTNRIADLTTGEIKPEFGLYDLVANFGLKGMVDGDIATVYLSIDGTPSRKSTHRCVAGDNIFNPVWTIRGDGSVYKVGISHNSSGGRALTTFADATLSITGK